MIVAGTILTAVALIAAACSVGGTPVAACMVCGCGLLLSGAVMLGMARSGLTRAVTLSAGVFVLVDIVAGFGLPLFLPVERVGAPLVLGLPLRAAIEVYGVGILPLLVLPVLFAASYRPDAIDRGSRDMQRGDTGRAAAVD
jgi:hypothetical protein